MVDIIMATYNGSKYIEQQIDSIISQTYTNWRLYIRDDGSTDNTVEIIKRYLKKYKNKIILIEDEKKGLGSKMNFAELMKYVESDYCMFADQDDFWLEDKVEVSLKKMKELENKLIDKPILVHSDLKVVDENLNIINESFFKYQNINPEHNKLNNLFVWNTVTGCTAMLNRELIRLCKNIPENCVMHDWWIALVASSMGMIYTIRDQTILYRQHSNNTLGAVGYEKKINISRVLDKIKNGKYTNYFNDIFKQVESFYLQYNNVLPKYNKELTEKFIKLKKQNLLQRKISVIKNNFNTGKIKKYDLTFLFYV